MCRRLAVPNTSRRFLAAATAPEADSETGGAAEDAPAGEAGAQGAEDDETAAMSARIEELERTVVAVQTERLTALAEVENTRDRAARDVDTARKFAISKIARDLLDVADNLERASAAAVEGVRGAFVGHGGGAGALFGAGGLLSAAFLVVGPREARRGVC